MQKSEQPLEAHRTVHSTCPVRHRTVRCHKKTKLQWSNPNGWVRTGLSGAPIDSSHPQRLFGGWGYKYPPTTSTPTIQAFITLHSIQEQSATLQDTNKSHRSDQSPQFNSSTLGLVRGSFLCFLVAWLAFFFLFFLLSKPYKRSKRHQFCVVVLAGSK
jgi:hypothetical protein